MRLPSSSRRAAVPGRLCPAPIDWSVSQSNPVARRVAFAPCPCPRPSSARPPGSAGSQLPLAAAPGGPPRAARRGRSPGRGGDRLAPRGTRCRETRRPARPRPGWSRSRSRPTIAADAPVGPLGFPLLATRNTTRVGGPDAVADAAAVALATHPPSPQAPPLEAAVLVEDDGPYAGHRRRRPGRAATARTAADQVRATASPRPAPTRSRSSSPVGAAAGDAAVSASGDVAAPAGLTVGAGARRTRRPRSRPPSTGCGGGCSARSRSTSVVASSEEAAYAMPAAAWAARSGDPVLFSGRTDVPRADARGAAAPPRRARLRARPARRSSPTRRCASSSGSPRACSASARTGRSQNAIEFARFSDESFGWNINAPRARPGARERRAPAGRGGGRLARVERQVGSAAPTGRRRIRCRLSCGASCSTSSPATRPTPPAPSTTTSG